MKSIHGSWNAMVTLVPNRTASWATPLTSRCFWPSIDGNGFAQPGPHLPANLLEADMSTVDEMMEGRDMGGLGLVVGWMDGGVFALNVAEDGPKNKLEWVWRCPNGKPCCTCPCPC
jgi:hypothetical protein